MSQYKIIFSGPVGAGKTTAINSLSDIPPVSTEQTATDSTRLVKSTTTVALDYGLIRLADDERISAFRRAASAGDWCHASGPRSQAESAGLSNPLARRWIAHAGIRGRCAPQRGYFGAGSGAIDGSGPWSGELSEAGRGTPASAPAMEGRRGRRECVARSMRGDFRSVPHGVSRLPHPAA